MPNIVLTRIDNRLIHGQVATMWSSSVGANLLLVANDEVCTNEFRQGLMAVSYTHLIKHLFVTTSIIESKARMNKQIDKNQNYNNIVNERRYLASNIYELYMWIYRESINSNDIDKIINNVKLLIEYKDDAITNKVTIIQKGINKSKNINTKIIISTILVILKELDKLSQLVKLNEKAQI